jgi:hypothetical protein
MDDCAGFHALLARAADGARLEAGERATLDPHLASCEACRARLADQRDVAAVLRARTPWPASPQLGPRVAAALDAARGDAFLDVVNWRVWTGGLAPVAAALALAAFLGSGTNGATETPTESAQASFDTWVQSGAAGTPAAVFLQPSVETDTLIETVLTGAPPTTSGGTDVR